MKRLEKTHCFKFRALPDSQRQTPRQATACGLCTVKNVSPADTRVPTLPLPPLQCYILFYRLPTLLFGAEDCIDAADKAEAIRWCKRTSASGHCKTPLLTLQQAEGVLAA